MRICLRLRFRLRTDGPQFHGDDGDLHVTERGGFGRGSGGTGMNRKAVWMYWQALAALK